MTEETVSEIQWTIHQSHPDMVRPAREQRLEDAGKRALAHGDAAGNADDVRRRRRLAAKEGIRGGVQRLRRGDVKIEQPRKRQVDRLDFGDRHSFVDAAELSKIGFRESEWRRRAQPRPGRAVEVEVGR